MPNKDIERSIRKLTSQQHAAISRRQALALGLGRKAIQKRIDDEVWVPARRGIYASAGSPQTWEQRVMLAVVSGGPGAVASHITAASLWRLVDRRPTTTHITVPHSRRLTTSLGRVIHRSRIVPDIRRVSGIPVTSPARTLVDIAAERDEGQLEAALDSALNLRLVSSPALIRYIANRGLGNRRGVALLNRLLDDRDKGSTESELERRFLRVVRNARLLEPGRQHRVGRRRIDFAYIEERIAIELDGFAEHGVKRAFEDDRRRQNELTLQGWVVLRFTWDDVTRRTDVVIATIEHALLSSTRGGI